VHHVTPAQLSSTFGNGWHIDAVDPVTIASTLPSLPAGLPGWRAALTRT